MYTHSGPDTLEGIRAVLSYLAGKIVPMPALTDPDMPERGPGARETAPQLSGMVNVVGVGRWVIVGDED